MMAKISPRATLAAINDLASPIGLNTSAVWERGLH